MVGVLPLLDCNLFANYGVILNRDMDIGNFVGSNPNCCDVHLEPNVVHDVRGKDYLLNFIFLENIKRREVVIERSVVDDFSSADETLIKVCSKVDCGVVVRSVDVVNLV